MKLDALKQGKRPGKREMKFCFSKGSIPENRTPSLFASIFSFVACDAAQFGC